MKEELTTGVVEMAKATKAATGKRGTGTRAGTKTRRRVANAPYRRELPERRDETVRAEIDQRVDEAALLREQILRKIERKLAEGRD